MKKLTKREQGIFAAVMGCSSLGNAAVLLSRHAADHPSELIFGLSSQTWLFGCAGLSVISIALAIAALASRSKDG